MSNKVLNLWNAASSGRNAKSTVIDLFLCEIDVEFYFFDRICLKQGFHKLLRLKKKT